MESLDDKVSSSFSLCFGLLAYFVISVDSTMVMIDCCKEKERSGKEVEIIECADHFQGFRSVAQKSNQAMKPLGHCSLLLSGTSLSSPWDVYFLYLIYQML